MSRSVVVDETEPRLSYHLESELESTYGMIEMSETEARLQGAVACSKCFDEQDGVTYDFAYLRVN